MSWTLLTEEHKRYVMIGGFVLVAGIIYYFSQPPSYHSYGYSNNYYGGGSAGLSWTSLALVMYAAYKLPPMFPEQLGLIDSLFPVKYISYCN